MSNTPPAVDGDPRLASMDDEFRALAAEIVRGFRAMSGARKKRVFHPTSTTVAGSLTVSPMPGAPRNAFFEPGRVLPLIIRFANGVQEDDAAWDNRGATLRVLSPERPDRLDRGLLDLLLTTGRTFSSRAARDFRAWMLGDRSAREAMVREHPRFGVAAWEMFRAIDWYTDVHYFTKVVQSYVDTEGGRFLTRFRLRDPRRPEDAGFLDAGSALLPPDRTSRAPGDERSRTFLHDELRRRVGDEGVDLLLELQVRSVPADPAERDDAADASRAWTEDAHPWHEAGRIHLRRVVANPQVESRGLQPGQRSARAGHDARAHRRRSRLAQPPALDRLRGGGCGAAGEGALRGAGVTARPVGWGHGEADDNAASASPVPRAGAGNSFRAAPARAPAQGGGHRRRRLRADGGARAHRGGRGGDRLRARRRGRRQGSIGRDRRPRLRPRRAPVQRGLRAARGAARGARHRARRRLARDPLRHRGQRAADHLCRRERGVPALPRAGPAAPQGHPRSRVRAPRGALLGAAGEVGGQRRDRAARRRHGHRLHRLGLRPPLRSRAAGALFPQVRRDGHLLHGPGHPPLLDAPGRVRQRLEAGGRRAARRALRRGDRGRRARRRRRARARGRRDPPIQSPRGRRAAPRALELARAVGRRGRALLEDPPPRLRHGDRFRRGPAA